MDNYKAPMAMKRLGDLFERYRTRIKAPQASVEKECLVIIKELTRFELTLDQIEYTVSTRTLSLRVPSILRTEILLQKGAILDKLKTHLGADNCPTYIR
jgi:hypothetical protein